MEPRVVTIREQRFTPIEGLTDDEAGALMELGRSLAIGSADIGDDSSQDELTTSAPGLIEVQRRPGDRTWSVKVSNAIGAVQIGRTQILVEPKIDSSHFYFLFHRSLLGEGVRIAEGNSRLSESDSLLASVWLAFLDALALSLRADLHHEYVGETTTVTYVRGRMDLIRTVVNLSRGSLLIPCTFEELSVDNPVNRVLRAACMRVMEVSSAICESQGWDENSPQKLTYQIVQHRSWEAACRMTGIGDLMPGDLEAEAPRLAQYQLEALRLAKTILRSLGRSINSGTNNASCFLLPTPPIVEEAVRRILDVGLGEGVSVGKFARGVAGMRFNPDLVVSLDGCDKGALVATGDVKYRVRDGAWPRSTFEQMVVFAEVFDAPQGFFIDFDDGASSSTFLTEFVAGRKYHHLSWRANKETEPSLAAECLVAECRQLLAIL